MSKRDYCHSPAYTFNGSDSGSDSNSDSDSVSVSLLVLDDDLAFLAACDGPLHAAPTSLPRGACRQGCDLA